MERGRAGVARGLRERGRRHHVRMVVGKQHAQSHGTGAACPARAGLAV